MFKVTKKKDYFESDEKTYSNPNQPIHRNPVNGLLMIFKSC